MLQLLLLLNTVFISNHLYITGAADAVMLLLCVLMLYMLMLHAGSLHSAGGRVK